MYLRYRYRDLPRASVHGAPKGTVASLRTSSMLGMRYIFISRVGYLQFKFRRAVEQISISKLWYGPPALLKVKVQPPCAYCRLSIQCLLLLCVPWNLAQAGTFRRRPVGGTLPCDTVRVRAIEIGLSEHHHPTLCVTPSVTPIV